MSLNLTAGTLWRLKCGLLGEPAGMAGADEDIEQYRPKPQRGPKMVRSLGKQAKEEAAAKRSCEAWLAELRELAAYPLIWPEDDSAPGFSTTPHWQGALALSVLAARQGGDTSDLEAMGELWTDEAECVDGAAVASDEPFGQLRGVEIWLPVKSPLLVEHVGLDMPTPAVVGSVVALRTQLLQLNEATLHYSPEDPWPDGSSHFTASLYAGMHCFLGMTEKALTHTLPLICA